MARACHPAELGDVGSAWKGRNHHLSSTSSHAPTPTPTPNHRGCQHLDLLPRKNRFSFSRHSRQPPSPPAQRSAEKLGVPRLPALAGAHPLQSQHCPQNPVSPRYGQGQAIFKQECQFTDTHRLLFLDLAARPRGVKPNKSSDHSFLGRDRIFAESTDRQPLQQTLPFRGQVINM